MDRPVSEHELLSLIEGRLPTERAEAVRAALAGDPSLKKAVDAMARDRQISRELTWSAERAAPAAMAGAALATAEKLALLAGASRSGGWRSRIGARRYALTTLLLFIGLAVTLVGAGVYWITRPTDPDVIYTRGLGASGRFEPAPDRRGPAGALPWPGGSSPPPMDPNVYMAPADTTPSAGAGPTGAEDRPALTETDPSQWGREIERKLEESAAHAGEDGLEIGGMALAHAVQLARAGRLRLVVPAEDPARWPRGAAMLASAGVRRSGPPAPDGRAPGRTEPISFTVELVTPLDERSLGLKDALSGLHARLSTLAAGPVRFEEIPAHSGEAPVGGGLPSPEPADVLWWAHPATKWTRAESILVGVRLEAAR